MARQRRVVAWAVAAALLACGCWATTVSGFAFDVGRCRSLKSEVVEMFRKAVRSYRDHAWPQDELSPVHCSGRETYGRYSVTLVDALDTMLVMGETELFETSVRSLISLPLSFDVDVNVSVFETNIRVVGGLLSAHLLSEERGLLTRDERAKLLDLAVDLARRLLPAFETKTGIPYGTVNLRSGVPANETTVTCTAGGGTFLIEFGVISEITGMPVFRRVARRALLALWGKRSTRTGLLGNHIDTDTGSWTAMDASVGSYTDSFYEYLFKAGVLFNDEGLMRIWRSARVSAWQYLRRGPGVLVGGVSYMTGDLTTLQTDALAAFWPGLEAISGSPDLAEQEFDVLEGLWRRYGALPERWDMQSGWKPVAGRSGYPLRPELVESALMLSLVTRKHSFSRDRYREFGANVVRSLRKYCELECGFVGLKDVAKHEQDREGRMDSYFLAETLKYLYLLFEDRDQHWALSHGGRYVFTTEAHLIPLQYRFSRGGGLRSALKPRMWLCLNMDWWNTRVMRWQPNPFISSAARWARWRSAELRSATYKAPDRPPFLCDNSGNCLDAVPSAGGPSPPQPQEEPQDESHEEPHEASEHV